jgi:iron complex transport system permease protein
MSPRAWLIAALALPALAVCMLLGASGLGLPDLQTEAGMAILSLRLHRVAAGFAVGAALAASGVVLQAVLRNPLAEPYVLGVSSGAGLGATLAILTGIGALIGGATGSAALGTFTIPACAFLGAILALFAVYTLAREGSTIAVYTIVLCGVIVSAVCSSLLMFLVAMAPVEGMHSVLWWMLGSLEITSEPLFLACVAGIAGGCIASMALARDLDAMSLGEEMAHNVGVRTNRTMVAALAASTLMTASAVALAGLIGFVGLIVPHVTRHVVGAGHRRLIPMAALAGGVFLAVADALGRVLTAPQEIPVGVITALAGGPFFLFLLRRRKQGSWEP